MENNPLRGLFGASSPQPEPQLVAPQATAPTKNIYYEIPSEMEHYIRICTKSMWTKFVDYLSLQVCPRMLLIRRSSLYL